MAVLLTKYINKSITLNYITLRTLHYINTFPVITWKNAIVIPDQKSNQSFSLSDFHPISILLIFSKVLERVVFNQLQVVNYFTTHSLFWTTNLTFVMDMLPNMCCTLVSNRRDRHDKNWWIITSSVCFTGNICHCITLHYLLDVFRLDVHSVRNLIVKNLVAFSSS